MKKLWASGWGKALIIVTVILLIVALFLIIRGGALAKDAWAFVYTVLIVGGLWAASVGGLAVWKRKKESAFDAGVAAKEGIDDRKREWMSWSAELKKQGIDRYAQPFYLLLGEPQSGKSVLLHNSELHFPFGQNRLSGIGGTRGCDWWFTQEAVILDLAGRLFTHEGGAADEAEWSAFIDLLTKYRPRCPANGILLVVPCDSLLQDSGEVARTKATQIQGALVTLANKLEAQIPVYLVLTKGDKIFGFAESVHKLDAKQRHQMFGWSRSDALFDAPFSVEEVRQGFDALVDRSRSLRATMLSVAPLPEAIHEVDRLYAFPDEFEAIYPALEVYLEGIFSSSALRDRLFFRGIYLTSGLQVGAPVAKVCADLVGGTGAADLQDLESLLQSQRSYFIRDLVQKRVFGEQGLVRPTQKRAVRARKAAWGVYGLAATFAVVSLAYSIWRVATRPSADDVRPRALALTSVSNSLEGNDLPTMIEAAAALDATIREGVDGSDFNRDLLADVYSTFIERAVVPTAQDSAAMSLVDKLSASATPRSLAVCAEDFSKVRLFAAGEIRPVSAEDYDAVGQLVSAVAPNQRSLVDPSSLEASHPGVQIASLGDAIQRASDFRAPAESADARNSDAVTAAIDALQPHWLRLLEVDGPDDVDPTLRFLIAFEQYRRDLDALNAAPGDDAVQTILARSAAYRASREHLLEVGARLDPISELAGAGSERGLELAGAFATFNAIAEAAFDLIQLRPSDSGPDATRWQARVTARVTALTELLEAVSVSPDIPEGLELPSVTNLRALKDRANGLARDVGALFVRPGAGTPGLLKKVGGGSIPLPGRDSKTAKILVPVDVLFPLYETLRSESSLGAVCAEAFLEEQGIPALVDSLESDAVEAPLQGDALKVLRDKLARAERQFSYVDCASCLGEEGGGIESQRPDAALSFDTGLVDQLTRLWQGLAKLDSQYAGASNIELGAWKKRVETLLSEHLNGFERELSGTRTVASDGSQPHESSEILSGLELLSGIPGLTDRTADLSARYRETTRKWFFEHWRAATNVDVATNVDDTIAMFDGFKALYYSEGEDQAELGDETGDRIDSVLSERLGRHIKDLLASWNLDAERRPILLQETAFPDAFADRLDKAFEVARNELDDGTMEDHARAFKLLGADKLEELHADGNGAFSKMLFHSRSQLDDLRELKLFPGRARTAIERNGQSRLLRQEVATLPSGAVEVIEALGKKFGAEEFQRDISGVAAAAYRKRLKEIAEEELVAAYRAGLEQEWKKRPALDKLLSDLTDFLAAPPQVSEAWVQLTSFFGRGGALEKLRAKYRYARNSETAEPDDDFAVWSKFEVGDPEWLFDDFLTEFTNYLLDDNGAVVSQIDIEFVSDPEQRDRGVLGASSSVRYLGYPENSKGGVHSYERHNSERRTLKWRMEGGSSKLRLELGKKGAKGSEPAYEASVPTVLAPFVLAWNGSYDTVAGEWRTWCDLKPTASDELVPPPVHLRMKFLGKSLPGRVRPSWPAGDN